MSTEKIVITKNKPKAPEANFLEWVQNNPHNLILRIHIEDDGLVRAVFKNATVSFSRRLEARKFEFDEATAGETMVEALNHLAQYWSEDTVQLRHTLDISWTFPKFLPVTEEDCEKYLPEAQIGSKSS